MHHHPSSLQMDFGQGWSAPGPQCGFVLRAGGGPTNGYTTKPNLGFSSPSSLEVTARGAGRCVLADCDLVVDSDTYLSYVIFPQVPEMAADGAAGGVNTDARYGATHVAVDLVFSDGQHLSDLGPLDQYRFPLTAEGQGQAKALYPRQWNYVECSLGEWAGRRIKRIELVFSSNNVFPSTIWISDLAVGPDFSQAALTFARIRALGEKVTPVDFVETRRGSNAGARFSRGNTFPAVAVPNGFTLASPMTELSRDWFYSWSGNNTGNGHPKLAALALSHAPSPWMGDRNQLFLSAAWGESVPTFAHTNEIARPDRWSVTTDSGQEIDLAATDHGIFACFQGAPDADADLELTIGSVEGQCLVSAHAGSPVLTGWVDEGSGLSEGRSRMFFYALFDRPVKTVHDGPVGGQKTLTFAGSSASVRLATSYISLSEAKNAWDQELGDWTFEEVVQRANSLWQERLSVLELPQATLEEKVSAYSSLYRVNLYPTSHTENVGSTDSPSYAYASPVQEPVAESTDEHTGSVVNAGTMYVNHGFWDTYRTVWPFYALVYPDLAAELADGFVEQARTAGWLTRWSSPGYANLMTGTSSDVAFADLYLKDIDLPDPWATYQAGLRNATAVSPIAGAGRHDIASIFLEGPDPDLHESVSWAVESALNDAALANMADGLADTLVEASADTTTSATQAKRIARLRAEATYLRRRSLHYRGALNDETGFFHSDEPDASTFDPRVWGGDYTETNAWTYAFPAPHDGHGLVDLHGGKEGLKAKLDEYFTTPENADKPGAYGDPIHEMTEAQDVRMGQFGMSNQPAHHIPFVYHFAGEPSYSSKISREVLRRMFLGSAIGQGYPGDEDNGEMSAWYLFALTGLYPLQMGSDRYVLTAPGSPEVIWHLPQGTLRVEAQPTSPDIPFAQATHIDSATVDGEEHSRSWISHGDLLGGKTLRHVVTPDRSDWATHPDALPPSLGAEGLQPWRDVTATRLGTVTTTSGAEDAVRLVGDRHGSPVTLRAGSNLTFSFPQPQAPEILTLTCSLDPAQAPTSWRVETSQDGQTWEHLVSFQDEGFDWPQQTRPFVLPTTSQGAAAFYRIVFQDAESTLEQVELLA